jgi:Rhs element Vgr protein
MSDNSRIPNPQQYTDLATYKIFFDGTKIDPKYEVFSIVVDKEIGRIPTARIVIADGDAAKEKFEISDKADFLPGKSVKIQAGYRSTDDTIFEGIVTKHNIKIRSNGGSTFTIECKDKAVKMTVGRHNKYYYNKKDSDIIKDLIGKYGLSADVAATQQTHKEMVQYNCSDWDFVMARAEINGLIVAVDDGKVSVKKPDLGQEAVVKPRYGATILEFEAEMDARLQLKETKAIAWKYAEQNIINAQGSADAAPEGNISPSKLAEVINLNTFELQHTGSLDKEELKTWADAQMLKSRMAKIRGRVKFEGFAAVKPAKMVELLGVGDHFNGKALVGGVRHEIGEGKWTSEVQFGLSPEWFMSQEDIIDTPAAGLLPAVHGLQIAKVVKIGPDPEGEDRIQVKMPMIDNNANGVWARVACLDAGKKRGSFFRPEIGDEVVVGFLNDDPRHAIILGQLHSSRGEAPLKGNDENHEKGFYTRSDMRIHFNDDKKVMTIQTPAGNKIVISEQDKSITIQDQNSNKMVMEPSGIKIDSPGEISIKAAKDVKIEGLNVTVKAQVGGKFEAITLDLKGSGQLNAEGSGMATLKSSGILTVQGSLVKIN